MTAQIEEKVSDCAICHDYVAAQQKEPLIPSQAPDLPWVEVASDIFTFSGDNNILSIDYYSKYIEVTQLKDMSAHETTECLEEHFSRQEIPEKLITYCGSQYASAKFQTFAKNYDFKHVLVSAKHPCVNGEAEAAVKIVKSLWRKNEDRHKSLLTYRTTPLPTMNLSPSQMCMARRLRTNLPMSCNLLQPEVNNQNEVKRRLQFNKNKQKCNYDRKPGPGSREWKPAVVVRHHTTWRSYVVDTGTLKCNSCIAFGIRGIQQNKCVTQTILQNRDYMQTFVSRTQQ
ncbi:uncharacterized protein LOC121367029 [Gigantopelta aegis]|uniref:uncharacterized protein LOC121367029 n=1 Tax=Gigantopelta aegis TaxID=1735272 RepID=UPI001B88E628|nr:uncharacterized protein LOC121367029 [Gigantopelta aegis]